MSRQKNQKVKIMVVFDILKNAIGKENALSTKALIEKLDSEYKIPCDRRTLADDVQCLQQYINDNDEYQFRIYCLNNGKENIYYSEYKNEHVEFSFDDLKTLITAVKSLPLTDNVDEEYTDHLTNKLVLSGEPDKQQKLRDYSEDKPYVFDTVAAKILIDWIKSLHFFKDSTTSQLVETISRLTDSEERNALADTEIDKNQGNKKDPTRLNLYQIDAIFRAISEKKRLKFKYFDPDENRNKVYRHDGKEYDVEPLNLTPNDGHYYLICYNPDEECTEDEYMIRTYRIDRMDDIKETDVPISEDAVKFGKKIRSLTDQTFRMYSGPAVDVTLEFGNKCISAIFDAFGDNADIKRVNDDLCRINTKVQLSPPFYAWLFMFNGSIRLVEPKEIIDDYTSFCKKAIAVYYSNTENEETPDSEINTEE